VVGKHIAAPEPDAAGSRIDGACCRDAHLDAEPAKRIVAELLGRDVAQTCNDTAAQWQRDEYRIPLDQEHMGGWKQPLEFARATRAAKASSDDDETGTAILRNGRHRQQGSCRSAQGEA